jgi:hypothetical protein
MLETEQTVFTGTYKPIWGFAERNWSWKAVTPMNAYWTTLQQTGVAPLTNNMWPAFLADEEEHIFGDNTITCPSNYESYYMRRNYWLDDDNLHNDYVRSVQNDYDMNTDDFNKIEITNNSIAIIRINAGIPSGTYRFSLVITKNETTYKKCISLIVLS